MLASQSNFQSRYWASPTKSQARSKTPTYHLLYGQKSTAGTQRTRVNQSQQELRNVSRPSNLAEWLESRHKTDRDNSSKSQPTARREKSADLLMDRQRILPAMPFNNSLYPHLKAKTAASVKPRQRREPNGDSNDAIILRSAPVFEPGLKVERTYTSGVLYTHVQSAADAAPHNPSTLSNSAEWTESKPAPFIVRQKLAKQFRELTRLKGENYDGATLMGFGTERLKEVILTMNAPSVANGNESSRRPKRTTAITVTNLPTREATITSDSQRDLKLEREPTFSIPEDDNTHESDGHDD